MVNCTSTVQSVLVNTANRLSLVFLKALILWDFPLKIYPFTQILILI